MTLRDEAARFNDPVTRAAILRQKAQERYSGHRAGIRAEVRRRESAERDGEDEGVLSSPVVPDGIVQADGSIHYLTDQEKEVERQRIEKFMAERGL